ncbi:unnamed protein product [Clavelina lepadiformis]|uniref:Uncharacterized protein n=1 Tax=Clavelina lepadiformis TaxID=159417 RepID=A0ABP0FFQ5_CLALP
MGNNILVARHERQRAVRNSHRQQSDEPSRVHRTERDMRTRIILTMTSLTTGVRSTTSLLVHTGPLQLTTGLRLEEVMGNNILVARHERQRAVRNSHRQQSDEPSRGPSD